MHIYNNKPITIIVNIWNWSGVCKWIIFQDSNDTTESNADL